MDGRFPHQPDASRGNCSGDAPKAEDDATFLSAPKGELRFTEAACRHRRRWRRLRRKGRLEKLGSLIDGAFRLRSPQSNGPSICQFVLSSPSFLPRRLSLKRPAFRKHKNVTGAPARPLPPSPLALTWRRRPATRPPSSPTVSAVSAGGRLRPRPLRCSVGRGRPTRPHAAPRPI